MSSDRPAELPSDCEWQAFVSYNKDDETGTKAAHRVRGELRKRHVYPWLYEEQKEPGITWDKKVAAAMEASRVVVLVLTPGWLKHDNCLREFELAVEREKEAKLLLTALVIKDAAPDKELRGWIEDNFSPREYVSVSAPVQRGDLWDFADALVQTVATYYDTNTRVFKRPAPNRQLPDRATFSKQPPAPFEVRWILGGTDVIITVPHGTPGAAETLRHLAAVMGPNGGGNNWNRPRATYLRHDLPRLRTLFPAFVSPDPPTTRGA